MKNILARGANGGTGAAVHVAAFGKHPGWDDHIDDIGLSTERLVTVKRLLYMDGVRGNIDAGAWDELDESERLEGFGHLLAWQFGPHEYVVGRLWSSTDGKGRSKYPMMACAHVTGMPWDWVVKTVLVELERVEESCRETTSASVVRTILEHADAKLAASVAEQQDAGVNLGSLGDARALVDLAAEPVFGDGHIGLNRIEYVIRNDMGGYLRRGPDSSTTQTRGTVVRPQHIRVPRTTGRAIDALTRWFQFIYTDLDPAAPVLLMAPLDADWVDIVAGEVTISQLFAIRTTPRKTPLASDIPYTLDDEFNQWFADRIDQAHRGELVVPVPVQRVAHTPVRSEKSGIPTGVMIGGAVAAVVVLLLAVVLLWPGGDEEAAAPNDRETVVDSARANESDRQIHRPADPPVTSEAIAIEGWDRLCLAYSSWLPKEIDSESRVHLGADPELSPVLAVVDWAGTGLARLDPYEISGEYVRLAVLMESPPSDPERADRAREAIDRLDELTGGIRAWHASTNALIEHARANGLHVASLPQMINAVLATIDDREVPEPLLVDQLVACVQVAAPVRAGVESLASIETLLAPLDTIADDDGWAAAYASRTRAVVANAIDGSDETADSIAALADTLTTMSDNVVTMHAFLTGPWMNDIDRRQVAATPPAGFESPDALAMEDFDRWRQVIDDRRYYALAGDDDPRNGLDRSSLFSTTQENLHLLETELEVDSSQYADLGRRLTELATLLDELRGVPWNGTYEERIRSEAALLQREAEALEVEVNETYLVNKTSHDDFIAELRAPTQIITDSPALLRIGHEVANRLADSDSPGQSRGLYETLKASIRHLDAACPSLSGDDAGGSVRSELAMLVRSEREQVLSEVASSLDLTTADQAALDAALASPVAEYEAWNEAVGLLADRLDHADSLLQFGYGLNEPPAAGATMAEVSAEIRGMSSAVRNDAMQQIVDDVVDRIDHLATIGGAPTPTAVNVAMGNAPELAVQLAAWRRLVDLGMTGDAGELEAFENRQALIVAGIEELPAERRTALTAEVTRQRQQLWVDHAMRATTSDVLVEAFERRERFAVEDDELPSRLRLNLTTMSLLATATSPSMRGRDQNDAVKAAVESQLAVIDEYRDDDDAGVAGHADRLATDLRSLIEEQPPRKTDFSGVGPGSAGLGIVEMIDGDDSDGRVTYRLNGPREHVDLTFVKVGGGPTSDAASYLCTEELSIEAFMLIVNAARASKDLRRYMPPDRLGVYGWRWDEAGGAPRMRSTPSWGYDDDWHAPGVDATIPSGSHPMHQLSPVAAATVTRLIGCRLPLATEWSSAFENYDGASASANRRDRTWSVQAAHLGELGVVTLSGGVFGQASDLGSAAADSADDGVLWFAVSDTGSDAVTNLVGNVAEVVLTSPEAAIEMHDLDSDSIVSFVSSHKASVAVIGGSALSPIEVPVGEPIAVRRPTSATPYVDVGVRLAFTAMGAERLEDPLAMRVEATLTEAGLALVDGADSAP